MNDSGTACPDGDRHRRQDAVPVLQLGADRLDPQLVRIDDLEQGLARVDHLAQMHVGGGDDAGDGAFSVSGPPTGRSAARRAFSAASSALTWSMSFCGTVPAHAGVTPDLLLGDLDGAGDLGHLGVGGAAIERRHRGRQHGHHVALRHMLANVRQLAIGHLDPAGEARLHAARCRRIGDHGADHLDGARRLRDFRDGCAHAEQPLRGLRHEDRAVGQPARHVDADQGLAFRAVLVGSGQRIAAPAARDQRQRDNAESKGSMRPVTGERCVCLGRDASA